MSTGSSVDAAARPPRGRGLPVAWAVLLTLGGCGGCDACHGRPEPPPPRPTMTPGDAAASALAQGRDLANQVGSAGVAEVEPCVRAQREIAALRERTGGDAPAPAAFLSDCAALPAPVQDCLRPSYAAHHVDDCVAARARLSEARRSRFDALARAGARDGPP